MQRPRFGSILAAAALATAAVIPLVAGPAGAVTGCSSGEFPALFASQSGLKIDCNTDAGTIANNLEVHDSDNAQWHHAAARNAVLKPASPNKATTAASATIKFAAGSIQTRDIRREISAFDPTTKAAVFKGGSFITAVAPVNCTTTCTSATLSQKATLTETTITAKIEMSTNRVLADAVCTAGTSTMTSATAKWVAGDVNKSVSGGPFAAGTFITSVSGTTATMNQTHSAACGAAPQLITIGAATYSGGNPVLFNSDPMNFQLTNDATGGQGFSCASGSHTLAMTAGSKADTGGFVAGDAGIAVSIKGATATVATTATAAVLTGNTSLTLAGTCPAGVTATVGSAWVGIAAADAPGAGAPMMTLAAELNLSSTLVTTQDNCANDTFEGFEVVGGWQGPGTYTANASTPPATVGQVLFPTSVLSFEGFVVPKKGGDTIDANPHYNFAFPILPTSLAVCLTAGAPSNPIQLAFGISATTKSGAPFLATGSGNPADPTIRQLLPETGSFAQTIQLIENPSTVVSSNSSTCVIGVDTTNPNLTCGDG